MRGTVEVPDGEEELNCVEDAVKPGACEDIAEIVRGSWFRD
jgi:hypothetical protein